MALHPQHFIRNFTQIFGDLGPFPWLKQIQIYSTQIAGISLYVPDFRYPVTSILSPKLNNHC